MMKYFVIRNFRGARSSFEMLKGYMLVFQNAERVLSHRKVGNPCSRLSTCHCLCWAWKAKAKSLYVWKYYGTYHVSNCGQQCNSISCCLSLVGYSTIAALSYKQRYNSANKMVWFYCYYYTTIHFNNLFLHRLYKLHCIQPSSGQAVINAALGSKSLATLARTHWLFAHRTCHMTI